MRVRERERERESERAKEREEKKSKLDIYIIKQTNIDPYLSPYSAMAVMPCIASLRVPNI